MIYRLLSEDLIESEGNFSNDPAAVDTVPYLCRRIDEKTGAGLPLIEKAIGDFIAKGYIKMKTMGENRVWYWTHNNRVNEI